MFDDPTAYGQIGMIQLHWESIFLSHQCVVPSKVSELSET